ncbi:MAG: hypothetical protein COU29_00325 [Candidatus Magasanikbacteria bacterium CG10_big_fil_rev_8_21_14_0_10_36_32]|uniref:Radical SAM core domain-containing protein n=1 Tax=Candidatus Magasanikbacteria bacterium CG10_big_fil_rev_8_21_14_0_10_36_32 TaxID=1974646 RepID=A0A2M6W7P6_9BACT|nr:MAG: hypothetical protein COU29_00325 [Candidatus Magasanikbacteria bacterium CG10_big_fil_rev_8_21_14_0_10_36_32]
MYEASPKSKIVLDIEKTKKFILTIDFNKINSVGFYGGEISSDYDRYQKFIDLVPKNVIKFTISNGTWSVGEVERKKFIDFVQKNRLQVFISTTKFHKPFQDSKVLEKYAKKYGFTLKGEDNIIPMGRAKKDKWTCSRRCLNYTCPIRLTLNPHGDIMFCNCDGVYPIIGTYNDDFNAVVKKGINLDKSHGCHYSF